MKLLRLLGGMPPAEAPKDDRAPDIDPDDPASVAPAAKRPQPLGGYGAGARVGSRKWQAGSRYAGGFSAGIGGGTDGTQWGSDAGGSCGSGQSGC